MSVYSCWLNVSGGLCNTNQEAAFGDKQNSLRNNSQSFPQNTWNMCFSEMLFISAKMDFFFFFFGFLTDYQNISIKLLWKKDWSSQNSQRWNACFTECLMFPAGDCTVLRLCPKQYGWYSVVLEIDPLFPRYSLLSGGGGLVVKSCPTLVSPWTVACQAPLSVGFSRQEYWSGLLFTWKSLSGVWLFATPLAVQSMEFSRPEYSSG